jgi:1-pyrroline-5-carboxylate dehydrogenase
MWRALPYEERAAVFLRAADLLAGPWRDTLNAATMLGQSKTAIQAEIDAACELIDFWRFNVYFGHKLLGEQPFSSSGVWNRIDHRPLEGFILAITPFNFTAIAGNLPTLGLARRCGSPQPQRSCGELHHAAVEVAGLRRCDQHGHRSRDVAGSVLSQTGPRRHPLHRVQVFQHLWHTVGQNIGRYQSYPRLVGDRCGRTS